MSIQDTLIMNMPKGKESNSYMVSKRSEDKESKVIYGMYREDWILYNA